MKTQRLAFVLMIVNLVILTSLLMGANSAPTPSPAANVLRGRSLELVDDNGRVRAELKVCPAQPDFKMPDGTKGFPESVLLRLIDSKNGPNVKLTTTEDGAGLVIGGDAGYIQILSRGTNTPFIKLVTKDGREQTLRP